MGAEYTELMKLARNIVADGVAAGVYHAPFMQPAFFRAGRLIDGIPVVRTLYRRSGETLVRKWQAGDQHYRRLAIGNIEFVFDVSDFTVNQWFFLRRLFEPQTTEFVLSYLKRGDLVFDVGANRGYFSILAGLKVRPEGRVIAFEPNPVVHADLERHVQLNGLQDVVECSRLALADEVRDSAEFFVSASPVNSGLSSLTPAEEWLEQGGLSRSNTIQVRTETLDRLVESMRLQRRVDLLKMDVEGAEDLVIEGMLSLLESAPPRRIILETVPDSAAHRRLSGFGYRTELLDKIDIKYNVLLSHDN